MVFKPQKALECVWVGVSCTPHGGAGTVGSSDADSQEVIPEEADQLLARRRATGRSVLTRGISVSRCESQVESPS